MSSFLFASNNTVRTVGNARWHMQEQVDPQFILEQNIPPNMASIYFVHPFDDDNISSSANLAVNDRFQVSVQPRNYTQIYTCAGKNYISAVTTYAKSNDLLKNVQTFNLHNSENYFFMVDVDDMNNVSVTQIDNATAMNLMSKDNYQGHPVSRIQPTCMSMSIE